MTYSYFNKFATFWKKKVKKTDSKKPFSNDPQIRRMLLHKGFYSTVWLMHNWNWRRLGSFIDFLAKRVSELLKAVRRKHTLPPLQYWKGKNRLWLVLLELSMWDHMEIWISVMIIVETELNRTLILRSTLRCVFQVFSPVCQ